MSGGEVGFSAVDGVVGRPRLCAVLDSPAVRVCIVQGPSGSGKTTLLRSWAVQSAAGTVIWISLARGIASRQTFWQHVASSLARVGDLSADVASGVREQLAAGVDPVRIAVDLLEGNGPVTLVLDAYEHLADAIARVDDDLARLLRAVPSLRVVIATRSGTALVDFVSADGRVVRVVTVGELALTVDEIEKLVAEQAGIDDRGLAVSVATATGGFALTVRSVVLALAQLGRIPSIDSMEWDEVVAARMESLLPDADAVRFVTDTSVPPYFDAGLAEQLSGHPATERLLTVLEHNGFGRWIPYGRGRPVFQYVESVRDTFRAGAVDDTDRFRQLCAVSAAWLLEHDEIDQALRLAIEGGDFALADRIFATLVIQNPDSYITDRFLPILRTVPEAALVDHPLLAFGLGLALDANPLLRSDAPRIFRIAIDSPARPTYLDPSLDAFSHAGMRAVASRISFAFRESADIALEALDALDAVPAALARQHGEQVGTILRQLSFSLMQGGLIDEAIATAVRSVGLCSSQTARNYSIVYAAGASAFAGDMRRARAFADSVDLDAWPESLRRSYLSALGVVAETYQLLDALDFSGAAEALQRTDSYTPTGEFWPFFTAVSLSARQGLGQAVAEAERVTRELSGPRPPGTGDNVATDHLHGVLARVWLAAGERKRAARVLDEQPEDRAHLAAARVARLLADERAEEALTLAQAALELPGHTLRTKADTRTVGAVAAMRCGAHDLAWSWVNAAAATWETSGARMHVAMLSPADRRLLRELARDRKSAAVEAYLEVPAASHPAPTTQQSPLTERELVVLRALAEQGSVREIAEALVVSPHTVKSQLQSLYRKLRVTSRRAAIAAAQEQGLLDRPATR